MKRNEENLTLDWDKIMSIVQAEDRVKEEKALERYRAEKPRILQRVLEQAEKPRILVLEQLDEVISPMPSHVPLQFRFATSDRADMEEIQERIGAEFQKQSIYFKLYWGKLYVLSPTSALFKFRKGKKPTADLNGKTIEVHRIENPSHLFRETIQDGDVVIDFAQLGLSIEEYAKVGFRIHLDELTVIEGRFSNE